MTKAEVHQGFRDDKKVEEHWLILTKTPGSYSHKCLFHESGTAASINTF